MKKLVLITVLVVFLLSACSQQATPAPTVAGSSATQPPAATATLPPSATSTPLPTNTPAPTETPLPTATFTPTATPAPKVLDASNAAQLQLSRRYGNGMMVQALLSPDAGQLLVLTSVHLKAFNPTSGEQLWEAETGSPQEKAVYTADGKTIVTITQGGALTLWDAATGKQTKAALEAQDGIDTDDVASNGALAALVNSANETTLYDASSGEKKLTINGAAFSGGIGEVRVSPDNATLWISGWDAKGYQIIQAWEVKTGKFLRGLLGISYDSVENMAVSPDNARVAGVSGLTLTSSVQHSLLVWEGASGKQLSRTSFDKDIDAFAFIPGTDQVLIASDGHFALVDVVKGEKGETFGKYDTALKSLTFTADGKQFVAAGSGGAVALYDLAKKEAVKEVKVDLSLAVASYTMSGNNNYSGRYRRGTGAGADPKGAFVAVLNKERSGIDLVDPNTLAVTKTIGKTDAPIYAFALSQDGTLLAAVDDKANLLLFDVASGALKSTIPTGHQQLIKKVEIAPDNSRVATVSGGRLGELYLWDVKSGQKQFTLSGYTVMAFSPDSTRVVSDNVDFGVYVWDTSTGKQLASPAADWIYDLAYSPDGNTVAISGFEVHTKTVGRQNLITLLDAKTNKMLPKKLSGSPAQVTKLLYSPDGKLLVSADNHGNIRVWNVESGEMVKQITETVPAPPALAFLNNGSTLVVAGIDGTLRFYEAR